MAKLLGQRYQFIKTIYGDEFGKTLLAGDTQSSGYPKCVVQEILLQTNNETALNLTLSVLKNKAELLQKLKLSDRIVPIVDFFTENGNFYLVEEYIEGSSFQSKLEPGVFYSEKEAVFLLENILETLAILHSYKLIIFYLKPENIIVKDDHQSILLDTVGIFRCIANQVTQRESISLSFQNALIYRAPEQNLQKLQENVDIYSLGIIAVQAVTGLNDFQLTQIIKAKASIERNMWRKELPNSLAIVAILEKMIHPLPERRYSSALDVLSELEQLGFYHFKELPVLLIPAKGGEQLIEKTAAATVAIAGETREEASSKTIGERPEHKIGFGSMEKFAIPELEELIDEKLLHQINEQIDSQLNDGELDLFTEDEPPAIDKTPDQSVSITEPQELVLEPDIFSSDDITLDPITLDDGELTPLGETLQTDALAQEHGMSATEFTLSRPSYDRVSKYMVGGLVIAGIVGTLAYGGYQWWKQEWVTKNYETQALALEQAGDLEGALSLYDQSLQNYPTGKIYLKRGLLRKELGQFKEAIDDFSIAIEQNYELEEAYYARGNVRFLIGDPNGAIADYTHSIDLNPNNVNGYVNRGNAWDELGNHQAAITDYNRAIDLQPDFAPAYLNRCLSYSNVEQQQQAINDCTKAIELRPDHPFAYQNRGLVRRRLGDLTGAMEDFNITIKLNPDDPDPFYNRGVTRLELGDDGGAIEDFSAALKIYPDHIFAHYDRGIAYSNLEQKEDALADFTQAAKLCLDSSRVDCYRDAQYQIEQLNLKP